MFEKTLGIIGGGQLGSMLAQSAIKLNIKTVIISDDRKSPAKNFADEFISDARKSNGPDGGPAMQEFRRQSAAHPIEEVGKSLREMMPWIASNRLVDKAKN